MSKLLPARPTTSPGKIVVHRPLLIAASGGVLDAVPAQADTVRGKMPQIFATSPVGVNRQSRTFMATLLRMTAFAFGATALFGSGGAASASDFRDAFPEIAVNSPHGVNLQTGRFSLSSTDLTLGPLAVQRRYSGEYRNEAWAYSISGYAHGAYVAHPAFGIASNLRGYLFQQDDTNSTVVVPKIVIHVDGQVLQFRIATDGSFYRWTVETRGWTLAWSGNELHLRHRSGTRYRFAGHAGLATISGYPTPPMLLSSVEHADGSRLDYEYSSNADLISIVSNRGYRLNFVYTPSANTVSVCGFNLASSYASAATLCSGALVQVSYGFGLSSNGARQITSFTDPDGDVTNYVFGTHMMTCVTLPNSSTCRIQNEYWPLHNTTGGVSVGNSPDQVTRQILADGTVWNYEYDFSQFAGDAPPLRPQDLTEGNKRYTYGAFIDPLGRRTQVSFLVGFPEVISAPDGVTHIDNTGVMFNLIPVGGTSTTPFSYTHFSLQPTGIKYPAGNILTFGYSDQGNNVWQRSTAVPNSGDGEIVVSRTYYPEYAYNSVGPDLCTAPSQVLCDKPLTQTDARGYVTDYTYNATHGGVLTATRPAVPTPQANGSIVNVRPQTRYSYSQIYAGIRNSGGSLVPAATPVWVLTQESQCRTLSSCAGTSDEILTTYEYGPSGSANALRLRGIVVSGNGVTSRTCYGYDALGNRISETGPGAQLPSCP